MSFDLRSTVLGAMAGPSILGRVDWFEPVRLDWVKTGDRTIAIAGPGNGGWLLVVPDGQLIPPGFYESQKGNFFDVGEDVGEDGTINAFIEKSYEVLHPDRLPLRSTMRLNQISGVEVPAAKQAEQSLSLDLVGWMQKSDIPAIRQAVQDAIANSNEAFSVNDLTQQIIESIQAGDGDIAVIGELANRQIALARSQSEKQVRLTELAAEELAILLGCNVEMNLTIANLSMQGTNLLLQLHAYVAELAAKANAPSDGDAPDSPKKTRKRAART